MQSHSKSHSHFFTKIGLLLGILGFKLYSYNIRLPIPVSRPTSLTFDSVRLEDLCKRASLQMDSDLLRIDVEEIQGAEDLITRCEKLHLSQNGGLKTSACGKYWSCISRDATGITGELILTQVQDSAGSMVSIETVFIVTALAKLMHDGLVKILTPKYAPEILMPLTQREKDVLLWTAEGKTAAEISRILLISTNTVIFHIKNIVSKLGASNKMQAAVKAAALGMFS